MTDQQILDRIADRAWNLLREERADRQWRLVEWADQRLYYFGLVPALGYVKEKERFYWMSILFQDNLLLPDWLRARYIDVEKALQAKTFRGLICRLTPPYPDAPPEAEGPPNAPRRKKSKRRRDDERVGVDLSRLPKKQADKLLRELSSSASPSRKSAESTREISLEEAAEGLRKIFEDKQG